MWNPTPVITFNGHAEVCGNYLSTGEGFSFEDETGHAAMKRIAASGG